jgi:hypothetical protein
MRDVMPDISYFVEFVSCSPKAIDLGSVERLLRTADSSFALGPALEDEERFESTLETGVYRAGLQIARIRISDPQDFGDTVAELKLFLADSECDEADRGYVSGVLNRATSILEVEIPLWEHPSEDYFNHLEPLWAWLFAEFGGTLHLYEIGFYRSWSGKNRGDEGDPDLVARST